MESREYCNWIEKIVVGFYDGICIFVFVILKFS